MALSLIDSNEKAFFVVIHEGLSTPVSCVLSFSDCLDCEPIRSQFCSHSHASLKFKTKKILQ